MVSGKKLGQFLLLSLPSLFLVVWAGDSLLLVAEDVFVVAALQVVVLAIFAWRYWPAGGQD